MAASTSALQEVKSEEKKAKQIKSKEKDVKEFKSEEEEVKEFKCEACGLTEKYTYFGMQPPFAENIYFTENYYVVEDPLDPPRLGKYIIIGAHCSVCSKAVCKDYKCSIYYRKTYCIDCAKTANLPKPILEKMNKHLDD